jgi:hypothetical protein
MAFSIAYGYILQAKKNYVIFSGKQPVHQNESKRK